MTSVFLASTAARTASARAKLKRSQKISTLVQKWNDFHQSLFRCKPDVDSNDRRGQTRGVVVLQQQQTITWPEVSRFVGIGLSGYWSLALFLLVGYCACHLTGPSAVVSILIAAAACFLSSKSLQTMSGRKYSYIAKKGYYI